MSSHSEVASRLKNSYYPPSSAFLDFVSSRRPNLTWRNFDLPAVRIKKNCYFNAMYFISQNFSINWDEQLIILVEKTFKCIFVPNVTNDQIGEEFNNTNHKETYN